MEILENQVFNLWDTNGRRNDVLNALSIYLNILKDLKDEGAFEQWASFPNSLTQLYFYQKAVEQSPEVFKKHPQFDTFVEALKLDFSKKINKHKIAKRLSGNHDMLDTLDKAIEQRARHYSSNLVKFGLATENRSITQSGQAYINNKIERDAVETFLPFTDINIILLRQLIKLRVFTKNINGVRRYYSPFFVSLFLLLNNDLLKKDDFVYIIQGLNPYCDENKVIENLKNNEINKIVDFVISSGSKDIPFVFELPQKVEKNLFNQYIRNRKSSETVACYFDFYDSLYEFRLNKTNENYNNLKETYLKNKEKLKKAFGEGKSIFDFGTNGVFKLNQFLAKNENNLFLVTPNFNQFFYKTYEKSKYEDLLREYSDTTTRALGATGLFKFKPNVHLFDKKLIKIIFSKFNFINSFFGTVNEEEYSRYEKNEENSIFGSNISLTEILNYSDDDVKSIIKALLEEYGATNIKTAKNKIESKVSTDFMKYIEQNYPKDKLLSLLELFSDRKNDAKIKNEVNPSATVPTIYEYLIGIAWYYLSNKNFDLYASFNMTLNADFEPEMHAAGGDGDIVINYSNVSIMLEVTLMNKTAQKKGEREPVLRHSLNNKAKHMEIDTLTFFIADELDYNTINIWRAVAAVPLRSTNSGGVDINGVIIMPLTLGNIISFIRKNVSMEKIINSVKDSFSKVPKITESNWYTDIIHNL